MEFKDYKIKGFIDDLSSDSPSPGGGAVAGLVSALASSLTGMVYSLTIDKKSFLSLSDENKSKMIKFNEDIIKFNDLALSFMEKDKVDFLSLMDSFKLPKNTEEEKLYRNEVIKNKTIIAMNTPLNLAKECLNLYENILFATEYGNENLISDATISAILLNSAIESSVINILINYNSLKGYEEFSHIPEMTQEMLKKSNDFKTKIVSKFNSM